MARPALAALWSLAAVAVVETGNAEIPFLALLGAGVVLAVLPYPQRRFSFADLIQALVTGAKYAIAVGAAAATVGIIVGVVTLTGVGFRITDLITSYASDIAAFVQPFLPGGFFGLPSITLFFTLVFTGVVCILLGCGIPTTANYIIMVTVAAPVLGKLGVEPIVAHFFVFYYGVLADITPPVALAAYAGASMAGADPFKTGNTAFRLGLAKALVPFVFVYSPAMLIVTKEFTWPLFIETASGCLVGIVLLAAALTGYGLAMMARWERLLLFAASIMVIMPNRTATLIGVLLAAPVVLKQVADWRSGRGQPTSAPGSRA
jgi:TRAP transporter 4TM/12TM fusion protein